MSYFLHRLTLCRQLIVLISVPLTQFLILLKKLSHCPFNCPWPPTPKNSRIVCIPFCPLLLPLSNQSLCLAMGNSSWMGPPLSSLLLNMKREDAGQGWPSRITVLPHWDGGAPPLPEFFLCPKTKSPCCLSKSVSF